MNPFQQTLIPLRVLTGECGEWEYVWNGFNPDFGVCPKYRSFGLAKKSSRKQIPASRRSFCWSKLDLYASCYFIISFFGLDGGTCYPNTISTINSLDFWFFGLLIFSDCDLLFAVKNLVAKVRRFVLWRADLCLRKDETRKY